MTTKDVLGEIYYEENSPDPIRTLNKNALRRMVEKRTGAEWTIENNMIVYNELESPATTKEIGEKLVDVMSFFKTQGIICKGKVAILSFETGKITKVYSEGVAPNIKNSSF